MGGVCQLVRAWQQHPGVLGWCKGVSVKSVRTPGRINQEKVVLPFKGKGGGEPLKLSGAKGERGCSNDSDFAPIIFFASHDGPLASFSCHAGGEDDPLFSPISSQHYWFLCPRSRVGNADGPAREKAACASRLLARVHLGKRRQTLLHAASVLGHEQMARFLCDHGAAVSARNSLGLTPLHAAFTDRIRIPVLRALLNGPGVDVNAEDTAGITPLVLLLHP